jgi:hypothetical protein
MSEPLSTSGESTQRTRKRERYYAHLVCGHLRPCDDDVREGAMLVCYACQIACKVEKVREVRR